MAELKRPVDEVKKEIEDSGLSRLDWIGPKPVSGPTPEDAMADLERMEGELEDSLEDEAEDGGNDDGEKESGA